VLRPLAAAILVSVAPLCAGAQVPEARYELAWRTRALERAWIATPSERHALAVPLIENAVQRFFGADVAGAAAALDGARLALTAPEAPRNCERFTVTPEARLLDVQRTSLGLAVSSLYDTDFTGPLTLRASSSGVVLSVEPASIDAPAPEVRREVRLSLAGLGPAQGEFIVHLEVGDERGSRSTRELSVSRATELSQRLASLARALAALPENAPALERATLRTNLALLESLATGSREETDFPAAQLLVESENLAASAAKGERWFGGQHAGQTWLTVPSGKSGVRVRVFVPAGLAPERKVPLVVALHGAGGSENMFFDAYGAGRIVELCRVRGWLLVAPRVGFLGVPMNAVLGAIGERYPVDRERVFLVGHSLGAAIGQGLVAKAPATYRAFAALGGGSGVDDARSLAAEPVFVGAGERDFGRRGAEALHRSLVAGGSRVATLRIYPHCEHLMVVTDALPDVFAWWDQLATPK
jgi:predicted esterase